MHQGIILGLLGEILEHFRLHGHRDARLHGGGGGGQLEFDGDSLCCATHAKREAMHVITDHKVGAWEDNVHDDLTKWRVSYKCQIINFFNLRPSTSKSSKVVLLYNNTDRFGERVSSAMVSSAVRVAATSRAINSWPGQVT